MRRTLIATANIRTQRGFSRIAVVIFALLVAGLFYLISLRTSMQDEMVENPLLVGQEELPRWSYERPSVPWLDPVTEDASLVQFPFDRAPVCNLNFDKDQQQIINGLVRRLQKKGAMAEEDHVWVPARFSEGDREYEVKARLRGDHPVHWSSPNRSWKIRFPKDNLFHGIKELHLIVPSDRMLYAEPLFYQVAASEGLLTFRAGFAAVSVDGQRPYVYYMVEGPSARFLAARERPESAIFRRNDMTFEAEIESKNVVQLQTKGGASAEYYKNRVRVREKEAEHWAALDRLLKAETREELAQVLNIRKYVTYIAICSFAGTRHGLADSNIFIYYDDTTGLFEPVPWDVNLYRLDDKIGKSVGQAVHRTPRRLEMILMNNDEDRALRDSILWKFSVGEGKWILDRFDEIHKIFGPAFEENMMADEHASFLHSIDFIRRDLHDNAVKLEGQFAFHRVTSELLLADSARTEAVHLLEISNHGFAPVACEEISLDADYAPGSAPLRLHRDANENRMLDANDPLLGTFTHNAQTSRLVFTPEEEMRIYSTKSGNRLIMPKINNFFLSGGMLSKRPKKFKVAFRDVITGAALSKDEAWAKMVDISKMGDYELRGRTISEFVSDHPEFRAEGKSIRLPAGDYRFDRDIIIPNGFELTINAGAIISMGEGASIVSYSPVRLEGTAQEPITFQGADAEKAWGVFAVIGPDVEPSVFRYVDFEGYSEDTICNTFLSGGVSIYSADANFDRCTFQRGQGEDALNFKNGNGAVENCLFVDNPSDAIDLDWSPVSITNSAFFGNKGDGIDLSGTDNLITGNWIIDCGDKGISVGEKSSIQASNNFIAGCEIGVASKDLSRARLIGCTLVDNETAISAYQKKSLFGGGHAEAESSIFANNELLASRGPWSSISFTGCTLPSSAAEGEDTVVLTGELTSLLADGLLDISAAASETWASSSINILLQDRLPGIPLFSSESANMGFSPSRATAKSETGAMAR